MQVSCHDAASGSWMWHQPYPWLVQQVLPFLGQSGKTCPSSLVEGNSYQPTLNFHRAIHMLQSVRIRCWRSFLAIWSFFTGWYSPMSRERTVFLPGPTTLADISCACIRMVNKVCHSWAGAAISGGIPTFVACIWLLIRELYADHTGTPFLGFSTSGSAGWSPCLHVLRRLPVGIW